ncbi:hypothetical protein F4779DRAFT_606067, partial [Xylariaceae sp. FL0662B]
MHRVCLYRPSASSRLDRHPISLNIRQLSEDPPRHSSASSTSAHNRRGTPYPGYSLQQRETTPGFIPTPLYSRYGPRCRVPQVSRQHAHDGSMNCQDHHASRPQVCETWFKGTRGGGDGGGACCEGEGEKAEKKKRASACCWGKESSQASIRTKRVTCAHTYLAPSWITQYEVSYAVRACVLSLGTRWPVFWKIVSSRLLLVFFFFYIG